MNQDFHSAYDTAQKNGISSREAEARGLLSCANILEAARQPGCSRQEFGDAIRHNQRLWTFFQVSLCEPENPLPHDLKVLLFNLSCYVDKVSFRAISERNPDLLRGLININRTLASGLTKQVEGTAIALQETMTPSAPPEGMITSISTTA